MQRQIVFGDSWLTADIPDETHIVPPGVSASLEPVPDLAAEVRRALDSPLDLPPLTDLARGRSNVLVAFDDPTVPCYAPIWPVALKEVLSDLYKAGIDRERIQLRCANALHRKFTNKELAGLIGEEIVAEFADRLDCHDAEDANGLVEIGTTPGGYIVELNKLAADSDLVIYLNCGTTRGFSGGWKSICVGLSSYRSIQHHHTPDIMSMSMQRNRMHEILDEMGSLVEEALGRDRFFKVETVLSNPIQVARIFAGSVGATRRAAIELNKSSMSNRRELLDEKVDVVAYGVPDWSPYAAYSFTNPILNLISTGLGYLGGMIEALGKPGCTVVLATPCPDRWDEQHHPSYKEVWERVIPETKDPFVARSRFEPAFAADPTYIDRYRNGFGFHGSHGIMALYPLKRLRHAGRVIVAGADDPSLVEHVGFTPAATFEEAIAEAKGEHGPSSSVALVEYPPAFNRT